VTIEIPQPGRRSSRRIAVWEPRPWWGPQLQHQFARDDVAVRECRQRQDVIGVAAEVVVVAATVAAAETFEGVAEACQTTPGVFVVVVVSDALRPAEWRLRDLGADVVVGEDVGAETLAAICRRALRTELKDEGRE
jgi:hypothetical protein